MKKSPKSPAMTRWPLIMHINYCEQGQTLEQTCEFAVRTGYDGIEFRRRRYAPGWKIIDEPMETYLSALSKAVMKSGLREVLFGGPGFEFGSPDAARRRSEFKIAEEFYSRVADLFNVKVCNAMSGSLLNPAKGIPYGEYSRHGSAVAGEDMWKREAEAWSWMADLGARLGIKFALETHMGYIHDTPQAAKKLADMVDHPNLGVNLDYDNAIRFEGVAPIADTVKELGPRLLYVHLKNSVVSGSGRIPSSIAEGETNHREYMLALVRNNYNGPVCVEAPRAGDREWFAKSDYDYMSSVLRAVGR